MPSLSDFLLSIMFQIHRSKEPVRNSIKVSRSARRAYVNSELSELYVFFMSNMHLDHRLNEPVAISLRFFSKCCLGFFGQKKLEITPPWF